MLLGRSAMCERDGKAYVERVPRSERRFEHFTKRKDMVVSHYGHFHVSLQALSSSLSSQIFCHFDVAATLGMINLHKFL